MSSHSYQVPFTQTVIGNSQYFVPAYAQHRPACQSILQGRLYEPATHALIEQLLARRPGSIVHAGTFFGDMLPTFARSARNHRLFGFEPVLENYVLARLTASYNNLDNVILFHAALGREIGVGRMQTTDESGTHRGGASFLGDNGQHCTILPLDFLTLPELSIIQLDVEGHEKQALEGAYRTISKNKPTILVEDNAQTCRSLLNQWDYIASGSIPGLTVFLPSNAPNSIREIVSAFTSS